MATVIFRKILSTTDINRRCAVPMKYFRRRRFPKPKFEGSCMVDFVVKDENDHDWILCCSRRKVGEDPKCPKHPKPVLIKGWIPFVRSKKLCVGDEVIIYKEQDETGSKYFRIKVEKRSSPPEAPRSPVMNQHLDGNKISESTAIIQPSGDLSSDVLNSYLGGKTAVKASSIEEEQTSTSHSTSQHTACYKTERPSLSLSLELTLKPAMTEEITIATSSRIEKEKTPSFHCTLQDVARKRTETPSLNLSLGLALKPTMTAGQQHAYMQLTEPQAIDFLRSYGLKTR